MAKSRYGCAIACRQLVSKNTQETNQNETVKRILKLRSFATKEKHYEKFCQCTYTFMKSQRKHKISVQPNRQKYDLCQKLIVLKPVITLGARNSI